MRIAAGLGGVTIESDDDRVRLGDLRPSVTAAIDGVVVEWTPGYFELEATADHWRLTARHAEYGLGLVVNVARADGGVGVSAVLSNEGSVAVNVERLVVMATGDVHVGHDPSPCWRTYRNGHQSWSGTSTLGTDERDRDVPTRSGRIAVTDARHPSPKTPGHVRSDWLSAICEPGSGDAVAIGFTTMADAFGFVELTADGALSVWADFDGIELTPGSSTPVMAVHVEAVTDVSSAGWQALGQVARATGQAMAARGLGRSHPGGWCSWYYYFTKVTEADVVANLHVLAADGRDGPTFGCEYVMIDDGHQQAIGDWLSTDAASFPSGMASLAGRITDAGFDAGLWWAPFLVSARSQVARTHPEWLVRGRRGRPVLASLNPSWGVTNPIWALDTTHPAVLDHLASVAEAIGGWGYAIQKLDFLFAASLPGVRYDRSATRAMALRRGLDAIRAGAGDDAFLLGCGCPLGPAVGVVDAMRVGGDVTPYWSNGIDRIVGRGRHVLATRNAVRNTLTRAVLDGAWWLNDPDCLMVRDTDTKLTLDEVRVLGTVFGMTNGMVVLSDRLDRVPADRRNMVAQARHLSGGAFEVVDLFEQDLPELIVSRHADRVDVAVLNLTEVDGRRSVDLARLDVAGPTDGAVREYWTGLELGVTGGRVDFGGLPPHSARVISLPV